MTDEPKHEYPDRHPPGSHWATDAAWEILDTIKPGVIQQDVRAWLAGAIAGRLSKERDEALSRETLHDLLTGACPGCGGTEFLFGPRGGVARNVECTGCKRRFNVTVRAGKVIFAQTISSDSDWAALGHTKVGPLKEAEV